MASSVISQGQTFPDVQIWYLDPPIEGACSNKMNAVQTTELFAKKRVALFGIPAAFTPTCSNSHLPSVIQGAPAFLSKGFDLVAVITQDSAFVVDAWGRANGADGKVLMLSDGNAALAKAMGISIDVSAKGMGTKGRRFAAVLEDNIVASILIDEPFKYEVSSAEMLLSKL